MSTGIACYSLCEQFLQQAAACRCPLPMMLLIAAARTGFGYRFAGRLISPPKGMAASRCSPADPIHNSLLLLGFFPPSAELLVAIWTMSRCTVVARRSRF
jgi:hypothetical protein